MTPVGRIRMRLDDELEHEWAVSTEGAAAIQRRLASRVVLSPLPADGPAAPRLAAGVDCSYAADGRAMWAACVVMDRSLRVLETCTLVGRPDRPYAAGYLAFREGRLTVDVLRSTVAEVDLIFLDGHGVVHERGLGLASHVGVLVGVPTVGVPKTPFHSIDRHPGPERGAYHVLTKEWGAQGAAIRLRTGVKPVYVSPGHLTDLPSAIALSLAWSTGRRKVPEPLARAHTHSVETRRESGGG